MQLARTRTSGPNRQELALFITNLLIALNVLVFVAMLLLHGVSQWSGFSMSTLLAFGGDFPPLVRQGEWYRLFDCMFVHANGLHLLMNMVALRQVGRLIEPYYGPARYTAIYLVAGIGSSLASLGWHWSQPVIAIGASGAIAGLIGAGAVAGQRVGTEQGRQFRNAMLRWGGTVVVFGLVVHADNAAHVGGFVVGAAGAMLAKREPPASAATERGKFFGVSRATWVSALAIVLPCALGFFLALRSAASSVPPSLGE